MYHFPASSTPHRSFSNTRPSSDQGNSKLNATQSKSASNPLFLKIEEELHDARRVRDHGQEEDMRYALDMVINRVTELSSTLTEAYKAQAELEIQLNLARSNLQVIQMNNEMLEDALKKNNGAARDLGWNRRSGTGPGSNLERSQSVDVPGPESPASATSESKFFKFRFSGSPSAHGVPGSHSRPGTPTPGGAAAAHNLTSPSMPSLTAVRDKERELEELSKELEKERAAKKKALEDKAALEDELESLSQALFEEANKMVAEERMKLSETMEELNEIRAEKQALQSALRLLDNQTRSARERGGHHGRTSSSEFSFVNASSSSSTSNSPSRSPTRHSNRLSTSSSQLGLKSVPTSPLSGLPPLPPSPFPSRPSSMADSTTDWTPPPRKDSLLALGGGEAGSSISPTLTITKRLSNASTATYSGPSSSSTAATGTPLKTTDAGLTAAAAEDDQLTPRNPPPPLAPAQPVTATPSSEAVAASLPQQPTAIMSLPPAPPVDDPWADVPTSTPTVPPSSSSDTSLSGSGGNSQEGGNKRRSFGINNATVAAAYAGIR